MFDIVSEERSLPCGIQSISQEDWRLIEECLGKEYHFQTFWHTKKNISLQEGKLPSTEIKKIVDLLPSSFSSHVLMFLRETVEVNNNLSLLYKKE